MRRAPGQSLELSLKALPRGPLSLQLGGAPRAPVQARPPPFLKLGGQGVQRPGALHGGGRGNTYGSCDKPQVGLGGTQTGVSCSPWAS